MGSGSALMSGRVYQSVPEQTMCETNELSSVFLTLVLSSDVSWLLHFVPSDEMILSQGLIYLARYEKPIPKGTESKQFATTYVVGTGWIHHSDRGWQSNARFRSLLTNNKKIPSLILLFLLLWSTKIMLLYFYTPLFFLTEHLSWSLDSTFGPLFQIQCPIYNLVKCLKVSTQRLLCLFILATIRGCRYTDHLPILGLLPTNRRSFDSLPLYSLLASGLSQYAFLSYSLG